MKPYTRVAAASALALLLAACGGGGGGGSTSTVPSTGGGPGTTSSGTGNVEFTISIPVSGTSSKGQRNPQYISPNTLAGSVAVNAGTPQYFQLDVAANPTNCGIVGSYETCTIVVQAQAGTDTFAWNLYSAAATPVGCNLGSATPCTADAGSILSTFSGTHVVTAGTTNNLGTFTLNPVIASFTLAFTPTLVAGTASGPYSITLTAKDPSGATIVAPGSYVNALGTLTPVTITSSLQGLSAPFNSTSWGISFSSDSGSAAATGVFNKPGDTVTASYGGLSIPAWYITGSCATPGCVATNQMVNLGATLGAPTVAEVCNDSYDVCTNANTSGSTATLAEAGQVNFSGTYTADSATLTPAEPGWTTAPYDQQFTEADTVPSCGSGAGAVVTLTAASGLGSTFTAASKNAGSCTTTYEDSTTLGQIVTVNYSVTTSSGSIQSK